MKALARQPDHDDQHQHQGDEKQHRVQPGQPQPAQHQRVFAQRGAHIGKRLWRSVDGRAGGELGAVTHRGQTAARCRSERRDKGVIKPEHAGGQHRPCRNAQQSRDEVEQAVHAGNLVADEFEKGQKAGDAHRHRAGQALQARRQLYPSGQARGADGEHDQKGPQAAGPAQRGGQRQELQGVERWRGHGWDTGDSVCKAITFCLGVADGMGEACAPACRPRRANKARSASTSELPVTSRVSP